MATPVFPEVYGFSINKRPTFATIVPQPSKAGRSVSYPQQRIPTWEFELASEVMRDETQNSTPYAEFSAFKEFQDLSQLFIACAGQYGEFFFEDTSDNSRLEQVLGAGDGAETEFLFIRTLATGSDIYLEPVGGVNINHAIHVYVDGVEVLAAGNWNLSADLTTLIFDDPPDSGAVITATFYYYYRCRFITNEQEFEEFLYNRWSAKGIRFRSIIFGYMAGTEAILPPWLPLGPLPEPEPPSLISPSQDGSASGITGLAQQNPISVSAILSTTMLDDLIAVFVMNEKSSLGTPQTVFSVLSSSGLAFTRRGGGSVVITGVALNFECWTAPSGAILTNEVITATFTSATGCAIISTMGVNGSRPGAPLDTGVVPAAYDGETTAAGPSVTISTTNAYDLLIWAAGGMSIPANGGAPTGFISAVGSRAAASFYDAKVLYLTVFKKAVSALQVSAVVTPSSGNVAGAGILLAIRN